MIRVFILLTTVTVAINAQNFAYSTDELEKFLLEAVQNKETTDFDFTKYKSKPCEPYTPVKPDFKAPGRRISEEKCLEYIWEMGNRDNETEWGQMCRVYLISEIKKGVFPEVFFIINSHVIFGGRPATPGEFPHMGAIGWLAKDSSVGWVFKCGSTLISKNFLLTAAHCSKLSIRRHLDIVNARPDIVRLGVENIEYDEFGKNGSPLDAKIKRFIVHPKYASPKKYNDIALIELQEDVVFMSNIHPACLWSNNSLERLGHEGTLTGWGDTEKGTQSAVLRTTVVDFLNTSECEDILYPYYNRNWRGFQENQLCAGKLQGGKDTCQGDSGGPLQVRIPMNTEGKMYWAVGVTSFGMKCGLEDQPGVYTRVSSYIDWIEEMVWGS